MSVTVPGSGTFQVDRDIILSSKEVALAMTEE